MKVRVRILSPDGKERADRVYDSKKVKVPDHLEILADKAFWAAADDGNKLDYTYVWVVEIAVGVERFYFVRKPSNMATPDVFAEAVSLEQALDTAAVLQKVYAEICA